MSLKLSGTQLGNITGGPSSLNLYELADVSISAPVTGQYLRYNSTISEWQNSVINTEVYNFLDVKLSGSNGVVLTKASGPQTVDIGLNITTSGDVTGDLTAGDISITLNTVNANVGTFGSASTIPVVTVNAKGLITAVSQTAFTGTAPLATSLAGGSTGALPYQSAAGVTAFLSAGTTSQVLVGSPTAPSWSNTPTLTGTNFTGIPNGALTNSSLTIGTTNIALGATSTTLAGLTSVTSTTFVGSGSGLTSIPNGALTNSSLTIGSTSISLGGTSTTLTGLTSVTSTNFVGNASTATTLATGRTISISTDATGTSASFDGSGNATIPMTLATVNSSPQTDTFRKITVNGKGLTTATSAVTSGDITTALGYTPVNRAGDTMTGFLILNANPVNALGAVTKQYVDSVAAGLNVHVSCVTATTATLASSSGGTVTYNNGAAGVGATLTTTGSYATIGGYSPADGTRILVKNEATQANNGIYVKTSSTVLTRSDDFDNSPSGEIEAGDFTFVVNGTLAGTNWAQTTPSPITVGTTAIVFSQLSGPGVYTAGTGIDITTNVISNTGVLSNVAGTGISVSGATGNVTVTNTGVTSLAGTSNQIAVSAATGAVTVSLPSAVTIGGTMTAGTFSGAGTSLTGTAASLSIGGNAATATSATQLAGTAASEVMLNRGTVLAANQDTATGNGFYSQTDPGSSSGLLVFTPGGSLGTGQIRMVYTGEFEFRNKTDSTTWNAWKTVLTNANYNSYSPTLTGGGASGTWGINITGNSVTAGGLAVATGTNNVANQIVRTDSSGYIQAGWINTISGDNGVAAPDRIYASNDAYLRYYSPANFKTVLNLPSVNGNNSWTAGANQFYSTSSTAAGSNPGLQASSTSGNGAYMSFHRNGLYAVNMGLDTDNTFRIGGWSAPANVLQLGMTGELTVNGNYNVVNYGLGMTGVYDSTKYQAVFSMGSAYRPSADGSSLSNMYGIAYTHTNAGGQSKPGLSHQTLFVNGGVTHTAIGTGIWTNGDITLGAANKALVFSDGNYIRNNTAAYGAFEVNGTKGGYSGLHLVNGGGVTIGMYDTAGNGGIYNGTSGWEQYYNRSLTCLAIGGSSVTSGYKLQVNGSLRVDGNQINPSGYMNIGTSGVNTIAGDLTVARAGGTTGVVYFTAANNKYLYYDGSNFQMLGGGLVVSGDVTAFSDIRVKKNIEVISDALYKVSAIRGVTFQRTNVPDTDRRHAGVIAQEVEKVLPEVVTMSDDDASGNPGMKTVAYGNMVGLLIEAIKELNAKVDSLKAEIATLKA